MRKRIDRPEPVTKIIGKYYEYEREQARFFLITIFMVGIIALILDC